MALRHTLGAVKKSPRYTRQLCGIRKACRDQSVCVKASTSIVSAFCFQRYRFVLPAKRMVGLSTSPWRSSCQNSYIPTRRREEHTPELVALLQRFEGAYGIYQKFKVHVTLSEAFRWGTTNTHVTSSVPSENEGRRLQYRLPCRKASQRCCVMLSQK